MKERFEGSNRPQLIAALKGQDFVRDNGALADMLASKGELLDFAKGADIIVQAASDNDIYLILLGVVAIIVNGAHIANRKAGQHVGEMAAIEPSLLRSATVRALEPVVVLRLSSVDFMEVAESFPKIVIPIAKELSKRLHQRNSTILVPNKEPKVFIISSSEAKHIAHAIRDGLEKDVFTKVWDDGVFFAGGYALEALEQQLAVSDFAIAVAEADDLTESRGTKSASVRDNVVFELGLFMGKLTRYRAVLVHPRIKDLKLPSDLQGLTVIPYEPGDASTASSRIRPVCDKLRELVRKAGVRTFSFETDS
jgi:CRP/FNR family cyclic AMP-dependent transcriptional regulator